jgi:KUP system potassium uptake protein
VVPTIGSGMAIWRENCLPRCGPYASSAADFLNLPNNAVVELRQDRDLRRRLA